MLVYHETSLKEVYTNVYHKTSLKKKKEILLFGYNVKWMHKLIVL